MNGLGLGLGIGLPGTSSGVPAPHQNFNYLQPDGVSLYRQPGGVFTYLTP